MFEGDKEIENYLNLEVKMRLASLTAGVDAPFGLGLTATLPLVELWHVQNFSELTGGPKTESGVGDVELRFRQDVTQLLDLKSGPRIGITFGVVSPATGKYLPAEVSKNVFAGQGSGNSTNRELNIGRGVWWVMGELDLAYPVAKRLLIHGGAQWRSPQTVASDGFAWGPELRANVGLRVTAIDKYLSVGLGSDLQRRGSASYLPDGPDFPRQPFANGGGFNAFFTPALYTSPLDWLSFSVSYRVPFYNDVTGTQVVQNASLFFSVSSSLNFGGKAPVPPPKPAIVLAVVGEAAKVPEIAALVVKGKTTIVDYWATWCAPCVKLGPRLEEFASARPSLDVVIQRVDATNWQPEDWTKYLPDAAGLPVLDVFGPDGLLQARLEGEAAERFEAVILPLAASPATK